MPKPQAVSNQWPPPYLHYFDDDLWAGRSIQSRSRDFTPLYVDRFRGPRTEIHDLAHFFWELTCVVSGTGALVGPERLPMTVDDVGLIPPGIAHHEESREPMDTIWIGFHTSRLTVKRVPTPVSVRTPALRQFLEQMWLFAHQRGGRIGVELDGMTAMAVGWFLRLWEEEVTPAEEDVIDRALRYLDAHAAETIYLADVAQRCGCSVGHFVRLFKRRTGRSPNAYLTELRLRQAARLLEHTDLPVSEIARQVGYPDQFYFSRVFRKLTGHPPTARRVSHSS